MARDEACRVVGISPRSYTRWRLRLRAHGVRALASRSSRPARPREAWKRREVRELIEFERMHWPAGKEKTAWRLQHEVLDTRRWQERDELRAALFIFLEITYNRERRHSSLDDRTPNEFNTEARAKLTTVH